MSNVIEVAQVELQTTNRCVLSLAAREYNGAVAEAWIPRRFEGRFQTCMAVMLTACSIVTSKALRSTSVWRLRRSIRICYQSNWERAKIDQPTVPPTGMMCACFSIFAEILQVVGFVLHIAQLVLDPSRIARYTSRACAYIRRFVGNFGKSITSKTRTRN